MNNDGPFWIYDHDYAYVYDKELDYAWYEEDTWDAWKFWVPITIIAALLIAAKIEEWYTRPPTPRTTVTSEYAEKLIESKSWLLTYESLGFPVVNGNVEIHHNIYYGDGESTSGEIRFRGEEKP